MQGGRDYSIGRKGKQSKGKGYAASIKMDKGRDKEP
jgi:hypothetical protein